MRRQREDGKGPIPAPFDVEGADGKQPALHWIQRLSHRAAGAAALRHMADMESCVGDARVTASADILLGLRKFGLPRIFVDEVE